MNCHYDNDSFICIIYYNPNQLSTQKTKYNSDILFESNLTVNFDEKTQYGCRACLSMPHLLPNGYVSACEMITLGSKENDDNILVYGKYSNGKILENKAKIAKLKTRTVENMHDNSGKNPCQNFVAKLHCAGYCLGECQNE